ncbi:hypothetical protein B0T09DRAFT_333834 [Sordaria sp. MPI-SDFR-AT-0083]|nr:hypothetical protein B0T09DRAFT_333834 [Sordaria sp. MPI-SDFR-AT-0083]
MRELLVEAWLLLVLLGSFFGTSYNLLTSPFLHITSLLRVSSIPRSTVICNGRVTEHLCSSASQVDFGRYLGIARLENCPFRSH